MSREEEEREIVQLQKVISQLHELKRRLQTDVCMNVMLEVLSSIIDELCVDVCVQVHRCHHLDLIPIHQGGSSEAANRVVDAAGYDIHGQIPEKVPKNETFNCDHCGQKVGAAKFAAHLAKCMGHGGRQQRLRGGGDAAAQPPPLSTLSSNSRPVPSPPPGQTPPQLTSPSAKITVAPSPPAKRASSPGRSGSETSDVKRPKGQYFDGADIL